MMKQYSKTDMATALILEVFRLNGCLLEAGNQLVAPIGLTSAKWQVMGVLAAHATMTASQIAKEMGLSRQAVQQTANKLMAEKIIEAKPNPYHKSAPLLQLTVMGHKKFDKAMALQAPWIKELVSHLSKDTLFEAFNVMQQIREKLEKERRGSD